MQVFFARPIWKKGDIIRNITTGKPWLVKHVFIDSCTMVSDPESRTAPATPLLIEPRDYDQFAKDLEFDYNEMEGDFVYKPIQI